MTLSVSGSTLAVMSTIVHLPDELAGRLATEAARRGTGLEQTAADLLAAALDHPDDTPAAGGPGGGRRRRLAFAGIGASGQARGGAQADELLGEGFGRD